MPNSLGSNIFRCGPIAQAGPAHNTSWRAVCRSAASRAGCPSSGVGVAIMVDAVVVGCNPPGSLWGQKPLHGGDLLQVAKLWGRGGIVSRFPIVVILPADTPAPAVVQSVSSHSVRAPALVERSSVRLGVGVKVWFPALGVYLLLQCLSPTPVWAPGKMDHRITKGLVMDLFPGVHTTPQACKLLFRRTPYRGPMAQRPKYSTLFNACCPVSKVDVSMCIGKIRTQEALFLTAP